MTNTDEVKGRAKEAVGALTNNDDLKREGKIDRATGEIKEKIDEVKDAVLGAKDSVEAKLHGMEAKRAEEKH